MSVFELCERAISLVRGNRLQLSSNEKILLEALNYEGLVDAHAQDEACVCSLHFAGVRDRLQQLYPWRFSRRVLALSGNTLPSETLNVLGVYKDNKPLDYTITGDSIRIYTDTQSSSEVNGALLSYTVRETDTSKWPAIFCDVFCYSLAVEICAAVTGEPQYTQLLEQKAQELIQRAYQIGEIQPETRLTLRQEIYNRAIGLSRGQRSINSASSEAVTQGVDNAGISNARTRSEMQACLRAADSVRDRLLKLYPWKFARKQTTLVTSVKSDSNLPQYQVYASLPEDCLKILAIVYKGMPIDYEVAASSSASGTSKPLLLSRNVSNPAMFYTARITDMEQWDGAFVDVYVYELAQEIVAATTNNLETIQVLNAKAQQLIKDAVKIGAIKSEIVFSAIDEMYQRAIAIAHGQRTLSTTSEAAVSQGLDVTGDINARNREELGVCKRSSGNVRDRLLQLYAWRFARKSAVLNVTAAAADGWTKGYKLPDDCLRVLAVLSGGEYAEYEEAGDTLYCNVLTPTVRYTAKVEDTLKWDSAFVNVYIYELAQEIISATTNSLETMQVLKQKVQELVKDAVKIGAINAEMNLSASEELYNRAISLVHGQRTLKPTSDASETQGIDLTGDLNFRNREELAVCKRSAGYVRDRLLELHAWDFAKKTVLCASVTANAGWKNGYSIPSDCLKVLAVLVSDEPVEYEVSDGKILCDGANAYVRYIAQVEGVSDWTPAFKDAFCCELAMEIASSIGMNAEIVQLLAQKSQNIINQAYRMGSIKPEVRIALKDEVCNRAIALAQGTRTISGTSENATAQGIDTAGSLNDRYLEAVKVAKRSYEPLRDRVLQMYSWQFARKTATVMNGGALPSDCLAVLSVLVNGEPCDWEITGGYMSVPSSAKVSYTAKITDGSKWDAAFKEVLCYSLAVEIVSATTANAQTIQLLEQKIQEIVARAYQLGVIKNETRITQKQEIFNRAINLVHGQRTVAPSSEASAVQGLDTTGQVNDRAEAETRACLAAWESIRDKLLQLHAWTFARKSKILEAVVNAPKGWRYGYELPADCLTVLTVITDRTDERETSSLQGTKPEPVEWEVSGGNLYCDFEPVTIRYTGKISGLTGCPAPFIDAMVYLLACEVMNAVVPMNEGAAAAIRTFQNNANEAVQQAVAMGLIRPETIIPVRHEICARAIGLIKGLRGTDHIDYLYNREQEELTTCLRNFNFVRDRLLQMYAWVFARKTTKLTVQAETSSGWRYGYTLPSDCLNVVSVAAEIDTAQNVGFAGGYSGGGMCCYAGNSEPINLVELLEYETTGNEIYANRKPIYLRYTARVVDTHKWAPAFTDAFCVMLAIEIALSVVNDKKIVQLLEQQAELIIQAAMNNRVIWTETGLTKQRETRTGYGRSVPWLDYSGIPTLVCSPNEYCGGVVCENNADEFYCG